MDFRKYPGLRTAIAMTVVCSCICLGFAISTHFETQRLYQVWMERLATAMEYEKLHPEPAPELIRLQQAKEDAQAQWSTVLNYHSAWKGGTAFFLIAPLLVYFVARWKMAQLNRLFPKPPLS